MKDGWKKWFIKGAGFGVGLALVLAAIVGVGIWYAGRPKPPRLWNQTALSAKEAPGFGSSSDGKSIEFYYFVQNSTNDDYEVESDTQFKVLVKDKDGGLSLIPSEYEPIKVPIFVPAKQKARLTLSLALSGIPARTASGSDAEYHESLRAYCQERFGQVDGFVLFDEINRYQINLPRFASEPPKKNPFRNAP